MADSSQILLSNEDHTRTAGASLCHTLYELPVTILLTGELGAGKTTFLQGLATQLGISQPLTSPTYALEQRYRCSRGELIHLDLYRLSAKDAAQLIASTDDHDGIRTIEWADRLEKPPKNAITIGITDAEEEGRILTIQFDDMPLPSTKQIESWYKEVLLPHHIIVHCAAVAAFACTLSRALAKDGICVRKDALCRAAHVHDLFRFVDFHPGGSHLQESNTKEEISCWQQWKERYPGLHHEDAAAAFLSEKGFSALAEIVAVHGPHAKMKQRDTIEKKLLYYADKRVQLDTVVTLEERFEDFRNRYKDGKETPEEQAWLADARQTERELFPNGIPD